MTSSCWCCDAECGSCSVLSCGHALCGVCLSKCNMRKNSRVLGFICLVCGRFTYKDCLKWQQDDVMRVKRTKPATLSRALFAPESTGKLMIDISVKTRAEESQQKLFRVDAALDTKTCETDVRADDKAVAPASPARRHCSTKERTREGASAASQREASEIIHRARNSRLWSTFAIASLTSLRSTDVRFDLGVRYGDAWRKCRFAVAWQQLWFPLCDGVRSVAAVYSVRGHFLREVQLGQQVVGVRALAQCARVSMAVAAESGVFVLDVEKERVDVVCQGCFCDICFLSDSLFALDFDNRCVVRIQWRRPHWQVVATVRLDSYPHGPTDTLLVTSDAFFVASWSGYSVFKFNREGQLRGRFGRFGCEQPGTLDNSLLVAHDVTGALLVCDKWNDRLQVLTSDGRWNIVPMMTSLSRPTHVTFDSVADCVWVLSDGGLVTSFPANTRAVGAH